MSLDLQIQQLDELMDSMPALAAPSRPRSQRKYIVTSLYGRIQELLKKNYSYDKICDLIESVTSIVFKVTTLRKYLYLEKVRLAGGKLLRGGRPRATGERKSRTPAKSSSRASAPAVANPHRPDPQPPSAMAPDSLASQTLAQKLATQPKSTRKSAPAPAVVAPLAGEEPGQWETGMVADLAPDALKAAEEAEGQPASSEVSPASDDQNPPAKGLLNEPTFNTMERD